jgi:hypothetical protein
MAQFTKYLAAMAAAQSLVKNSKWLLQLNADTGKWVALSPVKARMANADGTLDVGAPLADPGFDAGVEFALGDTLKVTTPNIYGSFVNEKEELMWIMVYGRPTTVHTVTVMAP